MYTFSKMQSDFDVVKIPFLDLKISMESILQNSYQILAIFFCKQMILSLIKRQRCISIRYSPYYKWINVYNDDRGKSENEECNVVETPNTANDLEKHSSSSHVPGINLPQLRVDIEPSASSSTDV